MAAPITWQTINGPSLAQAAVPVESAARLILGGIDRAGSTLTGYNNQQQAIGDRGADAQVQSFLERLQRVQSPEEAAALQASGELDALRAGLRPQDLAKVRGAEEARLATVRSLTEQSQKFDIGQGEFKARPVTDLAMLLAASGNAEGVASLFAANPNLPNKAAVQQALVTAGQKAELAHARTQLVTPCNTPRKHGADSYTNNSCQRLPIKRWNPI